MGTPVRWVRNGMGTETTSAAYRRTQTHESQSFSTELPEFKESANEHLTRINSFGKISTRKVFYDHGAVIAQVVERRLGKAEVTGSSPVNSL